MFQEHFYHFTLYGIIPAQSLLTENLLGNAVPRAFFLNAAVILKQITGYILIIFIKTKADREHYLKQLAD